MLERGRPARSTQGKARRLPSRASPPLRGGKLRHEYDGASFDVDVETMRRTEGFDRFPPFVSVEQ